MPSPCSHTGPAAKSRSEASFTTEAILFRLKNEGCRITEGRRAILNALFAAKKPLSLTEIQDATSENGRRPDYATVFRLISLLERMRVVQKVNLQRSCSYFELHDPSRHYDHIVCTGCGKVVLISDPCPLHGMEGVLEEKYGFRDLTHSLEFFGRCKSCAASPDRG